VWATVMSRPTEDRAIVDAGLKGSPSPRGRRSSATSPPPPTSAPPTSTAALASQAPPTGGDKIRLVPGHCNPTVNLYDSYVGIRSNRVEQLWPITARGTVY
jgi:3-hydroxy-D-aspartate aldolase